MSSEDASEGEDPREPVDEPPLLSVVLPAFNEQGVLPLTLQRVAALEQDPDLGGRVEVVVVSDGSHDETYDEALHALQSSGRGTVVQLVRNVGSHAALRCGLRYACGSHVALMAADGQDPPEALPGMLRAFAPGVDVVWGQRASRRNDPWLTRLLAGTYYRIFRALTGLDYPSAGLDFVVVSRPVVDAILRYRERHASLFLLIFNLGFGQSAVPYERGERAGGESRWTLRKKFKLAFDMLTSFSPAPLRIVSALGATVGVAGALFGAVTVLRALLGVVPVPGWASLMVLGSVMGGLTLVTLGLLGEYVWRILDEVRDRPPFLEARVGRVPAPSEPAHGGAAADVSSASES